MIQRDSYGFNTYVAVRIGEIQQHTSPKRWFAIEGGLNIADWTTRGKHPHELGPHSDWQQGPTFLQLCESEWPIKNGQYEGKLPEEKNAVMQVIMEVDETETLADRIDISRYSNLMRLLCTTARILRLYKRFKRDARGIRQQKEEIQVTQEISANELEGAKRFWIIAAQRKLHQQLKGRTLLRLCARVKDGIIVVGGRVERWLEATWNKQEFTLLPKDHHLSRLISESEHRRIGHLGKLSTVSAIRSHYWILGIHKIVGSICSRCILCKLKFKRMASQAMGRLPIDRIKPSPPFESTGVDYFGPFAIKGEVQQRTRGKCYGVILTCAVSRAVYVDLSVDYSTDSFLQVLRRFACKHGWPRKFHSDRGSQLVASSKELQGVVDSIDMDIITQLVAPHGVEWTLSPGDAPWMNGATESLVRSVKRALNAAIGDQVLKFSELLTVMYETGQLVNQRPIGRHPTNPDDSHYLCPNNLILGRATPDVPQGPFRENVKLTRRLCFLQEIVDSFWKKWSCDYFPSLLIENKWHVTKRNLMIGDVVLIKDSNAVRGQWKMGRVSAVHPSEDGKVRKVSIVYKKLKGVLGKVEYNGATEIQIERAVHNLIVIVPVDQSEED